MVQYCLYEPNVQVEDIQEALEDIMDEEFDTVCEDGSPRGKYTILQVIPLYNYLYFQKLHMFYLSFWNY